MSLHLGPFWFSPCAHFLPNRQDCRHSADETPDYARIWDGTRHYAKLRGSIILTSNKTFAGMGQVFGDEVLASAILDRLLHHAEVISINGPSYRLKRLHARAERRR